MNTQIVSKKKKEIMIFVSGIAILISTWCLLFMRLLGLGEIFWDFFWSWRQLTNDFLRFLLNSAWLAIIVITANAGLLAIGVARTKKAYLPLIFAALNVAFGVADFVLGQLAYEINAALLPRPRPLIDPIHHYVWPQILVTVILLMILFIVQSALCLRRNKCFSVLT